MRKIVIDTNVVVAAMRSSLGAAFRLFSQMGKTDKFVNYLSVPLLLEYESVLKREGMVPFLDDTEIEQLIRYVCGVSVPHEVFYLWRPHLKDPGDDMVLEIAVAGSCDTIITYNLKDFRGAATFGIQALPPKEFLQQIGELT